LQDPLWPRILAPLFGGVNAGQRIGWIGSSF